MVQFQKPRKYYPDKRFANPRAEALARADSRAAAGVGPEFGKPMAGFMAGDGLVPPTASKVTVTAFIVCKKQILKFSQGRGYSDNRGAGKRQVKSSGVGGYHHVSAYNLTPAGPYSQGALTQQGLFIHS